MVVFKGQGVAAGKIIGRVYRKDVQSQECKEKSQRTIAEEYLRLDQGIEKTSRQLEALHKSTLERLGQKEAAIFSAHLLMLMDPELLDKIKAMISMENETAESAVNSAYAETITLFEALASDYMQERAADLKDVRSRLIQNIQNRVVEDGLNQASGMIYCAEDITPSEVAELMGSGIRGFLTERGGATSHFVIMANALEIPTLIQCTGILSVLQTGDQVMLDADEGTLTIDPDTEAIRQFDAKIQKGLADKEGLEKLIGLDSVSLDGCAIELAGNIGTPADCEGVLKNDGEAIGLFRTEFLFFDRPQMPTEDEQFDAYRSVLQQMKGKRVVIRTLDIGGDKAVPYLNLPKEENPFLGYRGIRICLEETELFRTQIRAILRASSFGKAAMMFPMIANLGEFKKAKACVAEVMAELVAEGMSYDSAIEIGVMIEVPSAAIMADQLAPEVDFFSVGTNDLTQYTLAVDRGNEGIAHLYTPYDPAVLRLIQMAADAAHHSGKWIGICGEAAGDLTLLPFFLALQIDELSMSASKILKVRQALRGLSRETIQQAALEVLKETDSLEVKRKLSICLSKG